MKNILLLTTLLTFTGYAMEIENDDAATTGEVTAISEKPYTFEMRLPFIPIKKVASEEQHIELLQCSMGYFFRQFESPAKKPTDHEIIQSVQAIIARPQAKAMVERMPCPCCGYSFANGRAMSTHMRSCKKAYDEKNNK